MIAVHDGDRVTLGGAVLTAHLTPGHTKGCTTWTLQVNVDLEAKHQRLLEGDKTAFIDPEGYRNYVAAAETSVLAELAKQKERR